MVELGVFFWENGNHHYWIITKTLCRNYSITWRGCGDCLRPGCRGISRLGPQKGCQFGPLALDFSRTFARDKHFVKFQVWTHLEYPNPQWDSKRESFHYTCSENQVFSHPSGQSHLQWNWWARRIVWKPKDCGLRGLIFGVNRSTDMASRCGIQQFSSWTIFRSGTKEEAEEVGGFFFRLPGGGGEMERNIWEMISNLSLCNNLNFDYDDVCANHNSLSRRSRQMVVW